MALFFSLISFYKYCFIYSSILEGCWSKYSSRVLLYPLPFIATYTIVNHPIFLPFYWFSAAQVIINYFTTIFISSCKNMIEIDSAVARCGCAPGEIKMLRPFTCFCAPHYKGGGVQTKFAPILRPPHSSNWHLST